MTKEQLEVFWCNYLWSHTVDVLYLWLTADIMHMSIALPTSDITVLTAGLPSHSNNPMTVAILKKLMLSKGDFVHSDNAALYSG